MSDTETPEQWAANFIEKVGIHAIQGKPVGPFAAELAAVKRKADAADPWRAEALAAATATAKANDHQRGTAAEGVSVMKEIAEAIGRGAVGVTLGDKDYSLREAAKKLAADSLDGMVGIRLRRALAVAAAVADYARCDEEELNED